MTEPYDKIVKANGARLRSDLFQDLRTELRFGLGTTTGKMHHDVLWLCMIVAER